MGYRVAEQPASEYHPDAGHPSKGMSDHPAHTNVEGATRFADPEDHAYPLDTPEHRHAAASLFGMHKDKYSPEKQAEIERNIKAAE